MSDPVQRDYYAQQIARRLQVSPRAIMQLMADATRALRDKKAPPPMTHAAPQDEPPQPAAVSHDKGRVDLETHLLALLWRSPALLMDANVALTRANLETLATDDFTNPALRTAFKQISRSALGQPVEGHVMDDDWLGIIADHDLARSIDEADELMMREESVRTALRLRERNLARDRSEFEHDDRRISAFGRARCRHTI